MQQAAGSILKVLAYFDLFDYPLTKEEIGLFSDGKMREDMLEAALGRLEKGRCIFRFNRLYSLQNRSGLAERRASGNEKAAQLLLTARRISGFLFRFPFVRGIAISGSLSKNFADGEADIDYFIITAANRLWIARTAMHLFKKLTFITGRQHWYCMNYYVDETALEIKEKNIYTATEIVTLLPTCGGEAMERFFERNRWTRSYFPHYEHALSHNTGSRKKHRLKRLTEKLFNNTFGEALDNRLMRITARRWQKKEAGKRLNIKGGRMGLKADRHSARPNPEFFQQKLLQAYEERLRKLESAHASLFMEIMK